MSAVFAPPLPSLDDIRAAILNLPATQSNLQALVSIADNFATDLAFDSLVRDDIEAREDIEDLREKLHECFAIAVDLRRRTHGEWETEARARADEFDKDAA